ncbi:hypothetical protein FI667_g3138, partial [Globisporangium splendens]
MRNPFDVQSWIRHKRSKSHMVAAEKSGIAEFDSKAQLKLSRGSLRLRLEMLPNGDFLVNPPYSPRKSKKSADMNEGMLKSVINSLVTLVSEQQDDINELRVRLRVVHQEAKSTVSDFERFKVAQQTLSQSVQCYLENELSGSQVHLRRGESSYESDSEASRGYDTDDTDRSLSDMSILNAQSQITEMD